jgi:hypothetical protein
MLLPAQAGVLVAFSVLYFTWWALLLAQYGGRELFRAGCDSCVCHAFKHCFSTS